MVPAAGLRLAHPRRGGLLGLAVHQIHTVWPEFHGFPLHHVIFIQRIPSGGAAGQGRVRLSIHSTLYPLCPGLSTRFFMQGVLRRRALTK